jgi:hypothetical protein
MRLALPIIVWATNRSEAIFCVAAGGASIKAEMAVSGFSSGRKLALGSGKKGSGEKTTLGRIKN